jgi:hypothetical protein
VTLRVGLWLLAACGLLALGYFFGRDISREVTIRYLTSVVQKYAEMGKPQTDAEREALKDQAAIREVATIGLWVTEVLNTPAP